MLRTFTNHHIRRTQSLDGFWDFTLTDSGPTPDQPPREYDQQIHTPRTWETIPSLEAYRGQAWFRRTITTHPDLAPRLVFGGVSHTAHVFIDGELHGSHDDAFTPFEVLIPADNTTSRELAVHVDNTFGPHAALHIENDYYTYGGITRPVELQHVPPAYIRRLHATPRRQGRAWALDVSVELENWSEEAVRREVRLSLETVSLNLGHLTVPAGRTRRLTATFDELDVTPWSAEQPALYPLTAMLYDNGEAVDDLIERVGFREVKVRGKKLLLNGEPIRLRGVNRHEDHGGFGCAIPLEQMVSDLETIADLGCNFVRTCHYPNDLRFLDLCDELGIYVWEESHARCVNFKHPKFREQIKRSTEEMIDWHRNHPSIIMWGCLNECDSVTRRGRGEHKRVLELLKKHDPSRPVTFASNKPFRDICLDLVDIVSWNTYTSWYVNDIAAVEDHLKEYLRWLHSPATGGQGKPLIMSEFGAGAIPGFHHPAHPHWSEEYQRDALDEELRVYLNHPDVIGAAIWQFCDIRVTGDKWRIRPRTMNNKGIVDEWRRGKLSYNIVKQRMTEAQRRWEGS